MPTNGRTKRHIADGRLPPRDMQLKSDDPPTSVRLPGLVTVHKLRHPKSAAYFVASDMTYIVSGGALNSTHALLLIQQHTFY